jgi:3,4-dihydroxy 2-butanone 4-phosphate synthase/GTP cyclohydrolase II
MSASLRLASGSRRRSIFDPVEQAIEAVRAGRMIIVVDDENRENEGDLTMAAAKVTPEAINFMVKHGRGLVCAALTPERLDELEIPLEVSDNSSRRETAFCVSIDAKVGTSTGVSASFRCARDRAACSCARVTRKQPWTSRGSAACIRRA